MFGLDALSKAVNWSEPQQQGWEDPNLFDPLVENRGVPAEVASVRRGLFDLRGTDRQRPASAGIFDIFTETLRHNVKFAFFGEIRFQAYAIRCHKG